MIDPARKTGRAVDTACHGGRVRGPRVAEVLALACWGAAAACSHSSSESAPGAGEQARSAGATVVSPASAASAPSADSGAAASPTSWRGSYKSIAGRLTLPKDVSWRVPESPAGVGDGTLALTVESDGRVHGTVEGPLGPATVNGLLADKHLAARFARTDPADRGYTGLLVGDLGDLGDDGGTKAPGKVTGTMNATVGDATAIRTAAFELTPAPGNETH